MDRQALTLPKPTTVIISAKVSAGVVPEFEMRSVVLLSIAYVSRPLCSFRDDELSDLWECASENNAKLGITSALYFDDRVFYHVIEGDAPQVWHLMDKIRRDPRHTDVDVLVENDIASPSYRFWPVKLIDGRASDHLQTRFNPADISTQSLRDLNDNTFLLARI